MNVTLHFPQTTMPAMITRLTTYLLQHGYIFLQTCYDTERSDFEVLNPQDQPIIRLRLQATDDPGTASAALASTTVEALSAEAMHLLQHLLRRD